MRSILRLKVSASALAFAFAFVSFPVCAATVGPPPMAQDAGSRANNDEDREIEENLELLEHLDETADLDLLLELSRNN